jgi:hypothetical protein
MIKKIIYIILSLISFEGIIELGFRVLYWYDFPKHLCDGTALDLITANFNFGYSLFLLIICLILFIIFAYKAIKTKISS